MASAASPLSDAAPNRKRGTPEAPRVECIRRAVEFFTAEGGTRELISKLEGTQPPLCRYLPNKDTLVRAVCLDLDPCSANSQ